MKRAPLSLITAAGSQESASEQERREPIGAAGRPAQRPAEIELRIVNSPCRISYRKIHTL